MQKSIIKHIRFRLEEWEQIEKILDSESLKIKDLIISYIRKNNKDLVPKNKK